MEINERDATQEVVDVILEEYMDVFHSLNFDDDTVAVVEAVMQQLSDEILARLDERLGHADP